MKQLTLKQMFDLSKERWGMDFQLQMLIEELCELAVAASHLNRKVKNKSITEKRQNYEKFAEEIADAEFMLDEMKYYFNNTCLIAEFRKEKEKRLMELLTP